MMRLMSTQLLKLSKRKRNGATYFYSSWYDDKGEKHEKAFGSKRDEAQRRFNAFHVGWRRDRTIRNPGDGLAMTVRSAYARYQVHAEAHFVRRDGSLTGKHKAIDSAMLPMLTLFGDTTLGEIGKHHLAQARDEMVRLNWCVNTINERVRLIRQVWRWFENKNMAEAGVWSSMRALEHLKRGRGVEIDGQSVTVATTGKVQPVSDSDLLAVLSRVCPTVETMIRVQMATAMRPTELCIMRPIDIERAGRIWFYRPWHHKLEHLQIDRVIAIGPRAQALLEPYITRRLNVSDAVFSPREAYDEGLKQRRDSFDASSKPGDYRNAASYQARERKGRGGNVFTKDLFGKHIRRACVDAGIPSWGPNRVRHYAATQIRNEFGLEVSSAVLGHTKISTTENYAKLTIERAVSAIEKVG